MISSSRLQTGLAINTQILTTKGAPGTTFKKFKPFKSFKTIFGLFDGLNVLNGLNYLNRLRSAFVVFFAVKSFSSLSFNLAHDCIGEFRRGRAAAEIGS